MTSSPLNPSKNDFECDSEVYESSSDEWNSSPKLARKRNFTRSLIEAKNKVKVKKDDNVKLKKAKRKRVLRKVKSSSEDEEENDRSKTKNKNGSKKKKILNNLKEKTKIIPTEKYATGSFVILKKDAQVGDPKKHPCIWRVDGKALLQKYEPFDYEGKICYKTTSVYTGWSVLDRDSYAPVVIKTARQCYNTHVMIVELDWDHLRTINITMDSD